MTTKLKPKKKKNWDFQQNIILAKSNHLGQFVNEQHKTKQNNCALDKKKKKKLEMELRRFPASQ